MQTVQQLLNRKGWGAWAVSPETALLDALMQLEARNVGALVVLDHERLLGILSERDCVRRVMLAGLSPVTTLVNEVMSSPVLSVKLHDSVDYCMRTMTDLRVRHLPVVDGERVVGMISVGDIVKAQLSEQESLIHDLESYIVGSPATVRPPAA